MKKIFIAIMILSLLFSGCIVPEEETKAKMYAHGKNVTITGNGWEEGIKVHHYIYPTDAGFFLNMPGPCDDMGCVGKNITVDGTSVYYDPEYKRNEMNVNRIIVNGTFRGWL
ncbi:MAG: hypothetical protein WC788_00685 [Candidatus Paceibacterota bacterium]|jgi:hypothetical protein